MFQPCQPFCFIESFQSALTSLMAQSCWLCQGSSEPKLLLFIHISCHCRPLLSKEVTSTAGYPSKVMYIYNAINSCPPASPMAASKVIFNELSVGGNAAENRWWTEAVIFCCGFYLLCYIFIFFFFFSLLVDGKTWTSENIFMNVRTSLNIDLRAIFFVHAVNPFVL